MTQLTSTPFSAPITFARGRNGDVYGVTGKERGFRWDTVTGSVEQLGISAPTAAPTVTAVPESPLYYLSAIDVSEPGNGYRVEPTVRIGGGGTATVPITAGDESSDTITSVGHGLTNGLAIQFASLTGGAGLSKHRVYYVVNAATDTFKVAATQGGVAVNFTTNISAGSVRVPAATLGVARATLRHGRVSAVRMLRYGVGYSQSPLVTCDAPDGTESPATGAALTAVMSTVTQGGTSWQTVSGLTINSGGSGYYGRPRLVFSGGDGGGAVADPVVDGNGSIVDVLLYDGGQYTSAPSVEAVADRGSVPRGAVLTPVLRPAIRGKYWCAIRYIDATPAGRRGPIPSSISPLADIEVVAASGGLSWGVPTSGIESRVHKIELWRTTADQVSVLYKVAEIAKSTAVAGAVANVYTYTDSLSDAELANPDRAGFQVLPITLPNGQVNARRFTPPPQNKAVIAIFQDRAWYGVDVPGRTFAGGSDAAHAQPNTLYFSEQDEPESVPEFNELIIQENVKGQDRITALMPFGGGMVVFQERHAYRLTFVSQPLVDASIMLIGPRGCLNQRCWDAYDGVAYVVDSMGMYMLDGTNAVPLSDSVDTYWSEGVIHFASSKWFFVRVDPVTRIVRFFFSVSAGHPDRALCFHPLTKAWWEERYAQTFSAMECMTTGQRQAVIAGGQGGAFCQFDSGHQDLTSAGAATGIACSMRTGFFPFVNEPSRSVRVLFKPTATDCNLGLALHYNGSATPRSAAVRTDRGAGFTTDAAANATLNLNLARSTLGDATGYAVASYVGRMDDKSSGGDRHLGVALSLTRPATEGTIIYGLGVEGVGQ